MTPEEVRNYYAVPALAGHCGEGEIAYNGMRGLGEAVNISIGTGMPPAVLAGVVLGGILGMNGWKQSPAVGGVVGAVVGGYLASMLFKPAAPPPPPPGGISLEDLRRGAAAAAAKGQIAGPRYI